MDNNATPHPHARIWLIVTVIIVVVGLLTSMYYWMQTKRLSKTRKQASSATLPIVSPVPSPAQEPVVISQDSSPKKVAEEIKKININEIKKSVEELRVALASFRQ